MTVQAHNHKAAATWGAGGSDYDHISASISDSIEHLVTRLAPKRGEAFLDLATGTGWTARRLAQLGAKVTGVDMGEGVVAAAKNFAKEAGLVIDFRVGDAEKVELPNAAFDGIASTCGVMFASNPEAVAAELARLCKPGGRVGLTTWLPNSAIAEMFKMMRPYMPPPPNPAPPSPFEWGSQDRVRQLLGGSFDLKFETGTSMMRLPTGEDAWNLFVTGYGPTKMLYANAGERKEDLKRDFIGFHDKHRNDIGVAMAREYMVTIGRRK